jgi:calcineurin-like phosphoesterase family protein
MKLVLEKGQQLFFTSDTHYSHSNICRATTRWSDADNLTRDFKSLNHMNDTLVNNINEMVGEDDVLIHLGDWSFGGFYVRTSTWFMETTTITLDGTRKTSKDCLLQPKIISI